MLTQTVLNTSFSHKKKISNYYDELGITWAATSEEIKTSYKNLSLKFHPDKFNADKSGTSSLEEAEKRFKRINEAYHTLIDPIKRKVYDSNFIAPKLNYFIKKLNSLIKHKLLKDKLQELLYQIVDINHTAVEDDIKILMTLIDILANHDYQDEAEKQCVIVTTLTFLAQVKAGIVFIHFCRTIRPEKDIIDNIFLSDLKKNNIEVFEHFYLRTNNDDIYQPSTETIKAAFSFAIEQGDYLFVYRICCDGIQHNKSHQAQLLNDLLKKTLTRLLKNLNLLDNEITQSIYGLKFGELYNFYCVLVTLYKGNLLNSNDVPLEINRKFIKYFLQNPHYADNFVKFNLSSEPFKDNVTYRYKVSCLKLLYRTGIFAKYFELLITPNNQNILYSSDCTNILSKMHKEGILNSYIFNLLEANPTFISYLSQLNHVCSTLNRLGLLKIDKDYQQFENYDDFRLDYVCHQIEQYQEKNLSIEEERISIQALLLGTKTNESHYYWRNIKDDNIKLTLYYENLICTENLIIIDYFNFGSKNKIVALLSKLNQTGLITFLHQSVSNKSALKIHLNKINKDISYTVYEDGYIEKALQALLALNHNRWLDNESVKSFLEVLPLDYHSCEIINLLSENQFYDGKIIDKLLLSPPQSALDTIRTLNFCKRKALLTHENRLSFLSNIDLIITMSNLLRNNHLSFDYESLSKWVAASLTNLENLVKTMQVLSTQSCLNKENWNKLVCDIEKYHGENVEAIALFIMKYPHLPISRSGQLGPICCALNKVAENKFLPISNELVSYFEKYKNDPNNLANALIYLKEQNFCELTIDLVGFFAKINNHIMEVAIAINLLEKSELFHQYEKDIFISFYHYPHLAHDRANALIQLKLNSLLNTVTKDYILFRSTLPPLDLAWAAIELNKKSLLEQIHKDDHRDFIIQAFSQIQLKDSSKTIKLICFMIKQVLYLKKTKFNFTASFMALNKIDEKINEYLKKMRDIALLTTEQEIEQAAHALLTTSTIIQSCNFLGFSLFNSTDINQLTYFINKHFDPIPNFLSEQRYESKISQCV